MQGIFEIFLIIGAFQSFMLFLPLILRKHYVCGSSERKNNLWISHLYMIFLLALVNEYIYLKANDELASFCLCFSVLLELLYGPFLYLYIRTVARIDGDGNKKIYLHFIPAAIYLITTFVCFFINDNHVWLEENMFIKMVTHLQLLVYIFISSKRLHKYDQYIRNYFSSVLKYFKLWRKLIVAFFVLVFIIDITLDAAKMFKIYDNHILSAQSVGIVAIVMGIALFSYSQIQLFSSTYIFEKQLKPLLEYTPGNAASLAIDDITAASIEMAPAAEIPDCGNYEEISKQYSHKEYKYQRNRLNDKEARKLYEKLVRYMETCKPYKTSGLTLSLLANGLQVSTHHLSQVINRYTGANFYHFVNTYRVYESIRMMDECDNPNEKIISFMYESGFNSTSTFNTFFKRIIGVTPNEYRNKRKAEKADIAL